MTARERGGVPMSSLADTGGGWPCETMLRSWSTDIDTVTGLCQSAKRRLRPRSMCSCSSSVRQQKSP